MGTADYLRWLFSAAAGVRFGHPAVI